MHEKMKKFFEPLTEEFTKKQMVVNIIGALGVLPCIMLFHKGYGLWIGLGALLLWWLLVLFVYLTYRYIKNK
jgi:hypothetical protein